MHRFFKKKKEAREVNLDSDILYSDISDVPVDPLNPHFMLEEEWNNYLSDTSSPDQNKSVISHLISQLKIGMDLTKVTLPTFLLEKRSLLEFYADLFAYPDLFADITKKATAQGRMIACVRFYLSTFSAGRDSAVAKKPYNPVLGECFRCYYNVGMKDQQRPSLDLSADMKSEKQLANPLYWMEAKHIVFVSEQVSHHPPVSACFAENRELGVRYEGHVWTKSKFHGLSVSVEMLGPGTIVLIKHDEHYDLIYPNAVCRSILGVPWTELVGETFIRCRKSGFSAKIKFHPKPFYRGTAHKVSCEIFSSKNSVVCKIDGKWDEQLFINFPDGKRELFFDKQKAVRRPKRVRKLSEQDPNESRRLWFDVSQQLNANNVEQATKFKSQLEQKQRDEAKLREKNGVSYNPKYFVMEDTKNWAYKYRDLHHKVGKLAPFEQSKKDSTQ